MTIYDLLIFSTRGQQNTKSIAIAMAQINDCGCQWRRRRRAPVNFAARRRLLPGPGRIKPKQGHLLLGEFKAIGYRRRARDERAQAECI